MNPYVKSVRPLANHQLLLTFDNGEKRRFDLSPYLNMPVFSSLKNEALFKTVRVVSGSVEWVGEIDLSFDTLYQEGVPVKTQSKPVRTRKAKMLIKPAKRIKSSRAGVRN